VASDFAAADSSNLAGGVFIAHHPAAMVYSTDTPTEGWCANFTTNYALTGCEGQVNRIDADSGTFWFVIAAWKDAKKWCGAEFGFGAYDDSKYAIVGSGACGVGFEPLAIPSGAWPGPNAGVALATPGEGVYWQGNFVPIYYFAGYAYEGGTVIPLANNPTDNPFCGMANCASPPAPFPVDCKGSMGILQAGAACCPPMEVPGACCFGGGVCQLMMQPECEAAGGIWDGAGTCEPNPCPVTWACCLHDEGTGVETCLMLTQTECAQASGIWRQSSDCATYTCPDIRACCINTLCMLLTQTECVTVYQGDWMPAEPSCTTPSNPCASSGACCFPGNDCQLMTQTECQTAGGSWDGAATCDPNPCPTPAQETTWGAIKSIYR
jgi:hypothetical protein